MQRHVNSYIEKLISVGLKKFLLFNNLFSPILNLFMSISLQPYNSNEFKFIFNYNLGDIYSGHAYGVY